MNCRIIKPVILCSLTLFALRTDAYNIHPARPTHYFYTPTPYLNTEWDMVASLHEISYTLPQKLQMHTSILDNVGRICFGARYAILDNLNIGSVLAWAFASIRGHSIPHWDPDPRLGSFLCWGPTLTDYFELALIAHNQLGKHISFGADAGMMITPSEYWSIIGELGFSFDFDDQEPYLNTVWGVRVHPPKIPYLSFDAGIDCVETPPKEFARHFAPFIDAIFTMKTMR